MQGSVATFPFLINMDALFEKFVERWLEKNLPGHLGLESQRTHWMSSDGSVRFRMDLVVTDRSTNRVRCVLDSKYKLSSIPESADVQQVIAYAEELDCKEALLVYPTNRIAPHDYVGRTIRVRSAAFDLGGELDCAGRSVLAAILNSRPP
jgi:5-methylcytosine-specific restriction enzyme subunit McrC